jgi:hypothetical protein
MTRAASLSSINCTQCGAGLSVLGGGRVRSHVCGYCGAVLDTQDNYKVLTSIGKRDHPDSPVRIGMTLPVEGVEFTVIGTLGKVESWKGQDWRWVEHQLFSPTHGYAWLTWEDGHFTFSRKVRDFDMSRWVSALAVETAETPPRRSYRDESYRYYETSTSEIEFMEGEFNWLPRIGEKTTTVVLLGPDAMLGLREGETEREVERTTLLPRDDTARALGIDGLAPTHERHPLTPYRPLPEEGFLRRALAGSAALAVLLAFILGAIGGPRVLDRQGVAIGDTPVSFPFEITNTSQLARLRYDTDVSNDWVVLGTRITGPDGLPLVEGARLVQYYFGRDSDGAWSEGSRATALRFRPETRGTHQITIQRVAGTGGRQMSVQITEGKVTSLWMFVAAGVFLVGWIAVTARRALHQQRRFAGGDWHED